MTNISIAFSVFWTALFYFDIDYIEIDNETWEV